MKPCHPHSYAYCPIIRTCLPCLPLFPRLVESLANTIRFNTTDHARGGGATLEQILIIVIYIQMRIVLHNDVEYMLKDAYDLKLQGLEGSIRLLAHGFLADDYEQRLARAKQLAPTLFE